MPFQKQQFVCSAVIFNNLFIILYCWMMENYLHEFSLPVIPNCSIGRLRRNMALARGMSGCLFHTMCGIFWILLCVLFNLWIPSFQILAKPLAPNTFFFFNWTVMNKYNLKHDMYLDYWNGFLSDAL